jgi:plasmid maintenance system antidote protein VapI
MKGASSKENSSSTKQSCDDAATVLSSAEVSLAQPKHPLFGAVLRGAIKQCFGTSRAFAGVLGVTEGRVSQILSGAESIAAPTLEEILAAFQDIGVQDQIHEAWVNTFAPSPLNLTSELESEALARRLLDGFSELVGGGKARPLLSSFGGMIPSLADPDLRFRVLRAETDLALFLDRPTLARDISLMMLREAKEAQSNKWIATALFTLATSARLDRGLTTPHLLKYHDDFSQFMGAWTPKPDELPAFEQLSQAAIRDRGLALLLAAESGKASPNGLNAVTDPIRKMIKSLQSPSDRAIALEVLGRLLTAQGALFAAEDTLEEASSTVQDVSYDHRPKTRILNARIRIARRELDEANELLLSVIEVSYEIDDIHHGSIGERLRTRLLP